MSKRNPSRNSKSEKERNHLRSFIKGLGSDDTSPPDTQFDPSNHPGDEKTVRRPTSKRPKSIWKSCKQHFGRNSGTYITCVMGFVITLIILPVVNLNREMGETKVRVEQAKSLVQENKEEVDRLRKEYADSASDLKSAKTLYDASVIKQDQYFNQLSGLVKRIESIRSYLIEKFKARID